MIVPQLPPERKVELTPPSLPTDTQLGDAGNMQLCCKTLRDVANPVRQAIAHNSKTTRNTQPNLGANVF